MAGTGGNLKGIPREVLPGVRMYPNDAEVARGAARYFVDCAWQAIARDDRFLVALSGGHTPRQMFQCLASPEFRGQIDWAKVHAFWSDERAVPPTNPDSNYGMARQELLIKVPIPLGNVHRMEAEKSNIGRAAHEYEEVLRRYLELDDQGFPRFHLIFLGLGSEGHTASLFPGIKPMQQTSRWVSTPTIAKLNARRMTLTLPVLNAAQRVIFLVVGADKAAILHTVLQEKPEPPLPAQLVEPRNGAKLFLVDEAAGAELMPSAPSGPADRASKAADALRGKPGSRE